LLVQTRNIKEGKKAPTLCSLTKKPKNRPAAALARLDELLDEALKATFPAGDPRC
jgi:hypothetical protein